MSEHFSFSDWYKSNIHSSNTHSSITSLGVFSTAKRCLTREYKDNLKVGRSTELPKWSQFLEINKIFNEYVPKCVDPNVFSQQLFKIELTGAKVFINNKDCIIVEERKNSIITISEDNKMRIHIKSGLKMIFEYEKVKYCVIGRNLKLNRFFKK